MKIDLIIPRHSYGSLKDGSKRESLRLTAEGVAALDRLSTCSRSAAADLAIRLVYTAIFGSGSQLGSTIAELIKAANSDEETLHNLQNGFRGLSLEVSSQVDEVIQ